MLSESIKLNSAVVCIPKYFTSMKYVPNGKISFSNACRDGIGFDNFSIGIGMALLFPPTPSLMWMIAGSPDIYDTSIE